MAQPLSAISPGQRTAQEAAVSSTIKIIRIFVTVLPIQLITGCTSYWSSWFTVMKICLSAVDAPVCVETKIMENDFSRVEVAIQTGVVLSTGYAEIRDIAGSFDNQKRAIFIREGISNHYDGLNRSMPSEEKRLFTHRSF